MNEVAKNLKKIRVSAGMTQEELAEKIFVTRQTISNWETGKSQPDVQTLTLLPSFWLLLEIILINIAPQVFPGFLVFSPVFSSVYLRTMFITVMPLLSGMGLFLGFNRRNERS